MATIEAPVLEPQPEVKPQAPPIDLGPERPCPNCGAAMVPAQNWCLDCGRAVSERTAETGGWRVPAAILGGVLGFAALVTGLWYVATSDNAGQDAVRPSAIASATPPATAPPAATPPAATIPPATTTPAPAVKKGSRIKLPAVRKPAAAAPVTPAPATPVPVTPAPKKKVTHHTTQRVAPPPPKPAIRGVTPSASHDYDPNGDGSEHPLETRRAIDGDPETSWSTLDYPNGLGKPGVGLWVDAGSPTGARVLTLATTTPGMNVEVYGATAGPPSTLPDPGWSLLARQDDVSDRQRIALNTGGRTLRYFLVWVTQLPADDTRATIAEVTLGG